MEELIIKTAFQLMKKFGIRNFTMDMLSAEMGVSKKTIYHHYTSKEEILMECIRHTIDELSEKNTELLKGDKNPLIKAVEILYLNLSTGLTFQDSFLFDMKKYYSSIYQIMDEYTHRLFETTISDLLKEAQQAGVIAKEVDCKISSELYRLKIRELITESRAYATHSFETIFNHLVVYSMRGLLSDDHIHLLDYRLKK